MLFSFFIKDKGMRMCVLSLLLILCCVIKREGWWGSWGFSPGYHTLLMSVCLFFNPAEPHSSSNVPLPPSPSFSPTKGKRVEVELLQPERYFPIILGLGDYCEKNNLLHSISIERKSCSRTPQQQAARKPNTSTPALCRVLTFFNPSLPIATQLSQDFSLSETVLETIINWSSKSYRNPFSL